MPTIHKPGSHPRTLHIVIGGVDNGDKRILERLCVNGGRTPQWIVPKHALPGDEVAVYVVGVGFFATGVIDTVPLPRKGWPNRYSAVIEKIKGINPPISISHIRREIPQLTWANYPRSITTPKADVAERVRILIQRRRKGDLLSTDAAALSALNIEELRRIALLRSSQTARKKERLAVQRTRAAAIRLYVLARAAGKCEACGKSAPFVTPDGRPYLEPHHTTRLADGGPDHPKHVIATCPNCHRRAHNAHDHKAFNERLIRKLGTLEK